MTEWLLLSLFIVIISGQSDCYCYCLLWSYQGRVIVIDKNNKKAQRVIDQAAAWEFKSIEVYAHDSRELIDTTGAAGTMPYQ